MLFIQVKFVNSPRLFNVFDYLKSLDWDIEKMFSNNMLAPFYYPNGCHCYFESVYFGNPKTKGGHVIFFL